MLKPLAVLLAGALAFGFVFLNSGLPLAAPALAAQSSEEGGVNVVVTPKALGPGMAVWEFEVVMDTHSKSLDDNLAEVVFLVDEAGSRYRPVAWQGDPPGGHHRKVILQFSPPAEMPRAVELQIEGVGGAGTRAFRWELE